jgi:acyl-CoA synthetase (NDP forming)
MVLSWGDVEKGFAEADEDGRSLQLRIDRQIKETAIRVLGPNSLGVINHFMSFSTSFVPMRFSFGILQLSNMSSLVTEALMPIFLSFLPR